MWIKKKNSGCLGKIKKCHLIRQIISIYLCFRPRLLSDVMMSIFTVWSSCMHEITKHELRCTFKIFLVKATNEMYQWHQNPVSASCVWCGSVGFVWWWSPAHSGAVCSRVSKSVNESGLKPWSSAGKGWSACCRSGTNWHRKCQSWSTFMRTRDWQMGWGCICSDVDAVLVHHR